MKTILVIFALVAAATADVSHLNSNGYHYDPPQETRQIPQQQYLPPSSGYQYNPPQPVPQQEYLPPSNIDIARLAIDPVPVVQPQPEYLPPQPASQYIPPSNQYIPPSNQYIPPSNQYIPPSNEYIPPAASEPQPAHTLTDDGYHYKNPNF